MTKERTVKPVKIALKILILIILISVILSAVLISMDENDINFDWSTLNLKAVAEKLHIENSINQAKTSVLMILTFPGLQNMTVIYWCLQIMISG